MQSKVRLTKRQMKEDRFTTFMLTSKDKLRNELEDRWQYYVIGLVVVIVLIWAVAWQINREAEKEILASETFSKAVLSYQSGLQEQAILEFTQILDNYGGSEVAAPSAFFLGNLNLSARNYTEATRYYRMYLSDFSGNTLNRAAALAGIGAAQEDQGQYTEAAASFVAAIEEYPGGPLEPDYEMGAIRNYLAVDQLDLAEARRALLEENHSGTSWATRANRLLAEKRSGR